MAEISLEALVAVSKEGQESVLVSPEGLRKLLSILALGSSPNGNDTLALLAAANSESFLHCDHRDIDLDASGLASYNFLFHNSTTSVYSAVKQVIRGIGYSYVKMVPEHKQVRWLRKINDDIASWSNGLIQEAFDDWLLSDDLTIANLLYFEGR